MSTSRSHPATTSWTLKSNPRFLLYWLFKKKNVNTMKLILLVIALSVALSFLGIM